MLEEDLETPQRQRKLLPKIVFGLGVVLLTVAALMFYNASATQPPAAPQLAAGQPSGATADDAADGQSGAGILTLLDALLTNTEATDEPAGPPRAELDQAAFPRAPDGWNLMIAEGSGQTEVVARAVFDAMYTPGEPLRVSTLYDLVESLQPETPVSGSDDETAASQSGDTSAATGDQSDQGRVYVSGETVVMVMIRRLPPGSAAKQSWLQAAAPGAPVPQDMAGRPFMESAGTAESDAIHALRLDITEDLFIEIGGRVDRATLRQFAEGIDYDAL
jgi:hypothetical protein